MKRADLAAAEVDAIQKLNESCATSFSGEALSAFHFAARQLKRAEEAVLAARQAYGEAVKRLSDEAVK